MTAVSSGDEDRSEDIYADFNDYCVHSSSVTGVKLNSRYYFHKSD